MSLLLQRLRRQAGVDSKAGEGKDDSLPVTPSPQPGGDEGQQGGNDDEYYYYYYDDYPGEGEAGKKDDKNITSFVVFYTYRLPTCLTL